MIRYQPVRHRTWCPFIFNCATASSARALARPCSSCHTKLVKRWRMSHSFLEFRCISRVTSKKSSIPAVSSDERVDPVFCHYRMHSETLVWKALHRGAHIWATKTWRDVWRLTASGHATFLVWITDISHALTWRQTFLISSSSMTRNIGRHGKAMENDA